MTQTFADPPDLVLFLKDDHTHPSINFDHYSSWYFGQFLRGEVWQNCDAQIVRCHVGTLTTKLFSNCFVLLMVFGLFELKYIEGETWKIRVCFSALFEWFDRSAEMAGAYLTQLPFNRLAFGFRAYLLIGHTSSAGCNLQLINSVLLQSYSK